MLLVLGGAAPASAHAALRDSDPRDAEVLKTAPRHVTLGFTESVSLLDDSIRVVDPDNRPVRVSEAGRAKGRSDTARVRLPRDLADGTYTIAWRVVSADSHPVSGALIFSVGKPSATKAVVAPRTEDPVTESLYNITRYLAYGGLILLIGVTVFSLLFSGFTDVLRRLPIGGWWALLASSLALFVLRGPYERGTGVGGALDPELLGQTATSRPGLALLARLALLAGAFVLVRRWAGPRKESSGAEGAGPESSGAGAAGPESSGGGTGTAPGRVSAALGLLLSVGLAFTWAASEHASAGIQVPVAMTSSVLHLLATAVWLGGLTALMALLHNAPHRLSSGIVSRFSRMAFVSVVVLAVTGVYQSWRGLGSWDAFTSTPYGGLLLAKLAAVALLLAGAGLSRRWTLRWATEDGETRAAEETFAGQRARTRVPERVGAPAGKPSHGTSDGTSDGTGGGIADGTSGGSSGPGGTEDSDGTPDPDAPSDPGTAAEAEAEAPTPKHSPKHSPEHSTERSPDRHRHALRRSVLAEFMVALVVLVITTVLTGTLPGRAEAESASSAGAGTTAPDEPTASTHSVPFDVGTPNGKGSIQLDLAPGTVGKNSVQGVVFGPDGGIATVPEVRLTFTLCSQGVGPIDARLENRGGYWATDSLQLPLPGTWTMKITVRTTDVDQVTVERDVKIS